MKERMKELAAKVGLPPGMGGHRASKRTFENTFAEQARCWTDAVAPPPMYIQSHSMVLTAGRGTIYDWDTVSAAWLPLPVGLDSEFWSGYHVILRKGVFGATPKMD
eukprot:1192873-Prorocentrum_minimum.AAC.1